MDVKKVIKVFLASPMDLLKERGEFKEALSRVNATVGRAAGIEFETICWEKDTFPGFGDDAQDVVNRQITADFDIFVCMFKSRLGTPTKRYDSGTVEEYERVRHKKIYKTDLDIMTYFFECDDAMPEVLEFKRKIGNDGALFWDVRREDSFPDLIFNHFAKKMLDIKQKEAPKEKASEVTDGKMKNAGSVALVTGDEVLIVKRPLSAKIGAGLWQLPGGKKNPGESDEQTAVREIYEETGYSVSERNLTRINSFDTNLCGDPTKPFKMTLFICRLEEKPPICLSDEASEYHWLSLSSPNFDDRAYLGINRLMLTIIYKEIHLTGGLRALSSFLSLSRGEGLPMQIPTLSEEKSNSTYALLSLLGVVSFDKGVSFTSNYSPIILKELISVLSGGESIFTNDNNALIRGVKLSVPDMKQLKSVREQAFYSNKALASALSCKAELEGSVRQICDTLIFGRCGERIYLLMRWDFFADKYQVICKGVNGKDTDIHERAAQVISARLPAAASFFDMEFIKSSEVCHFSAGSVDNDPVLRKYLIDIVLLQAKKRFCSDIIRAVETVNEQTYTEIEYSYEINRRSAIDFNFYLWCDLEELITSPTLYRGDAVRGIDEIIRSIGASVLRELCYNAIELTEEQLCNEYFEDAKRQFSKKYRDG